MLKILSIIIAIQSLIACGGIAVDSKAPNSSSTSSNSSSSSGEATESPARITQIRASTHDGNLPSNVLDGDLETRWSANGVGQELEILFAKEKQVFAIELAFYKGNERQAYFDIYIKQGMDWILAMKDLRSSGNTNQFERFALHNTMASGVRIMGNGNSENGFNSITEVRILNSNDTAFLVDLPPESYSQRVLTIDFNDMQIGSTYDSKEEATVSSACSPSTNNNCLRSRYQPSDVGSARQLKQESIPPANEYTLQFDVRFDHNFDFKLGGKLHGLGPSTVTDGCLEQVPNGWSARVMWQPDAKAILYIYDQNRIAQNKACGFGYGFNGSTSDFPNGVAFKAGHYQAISLYVKLNTMGNLNDGVAQLWIDGKLYVEKTGIRYRNTTQDSAISQFLFSTFFGGNDRSWAPNQTVYANFDNFEVWTGKRIRNVPGS